MRRDAREQVDLLKIELATFKVLMSEIHPEFKKRYIEVKGKIAQKVDPEALM
jgi:hypothetical protein